MNKLKSYNKIELITRILAFATVIAIVVQLIMLIVDFRESYHMDHSGLEIFNYSTFNFKFFIVDFILMFFIPVQIAMFPIVILFKGGREKLPVLIYMITTATFSLNDVVCMVTPYSYITNIDVFYLLADIFCTVSALLILLKDENKIVKIIAYLLQLPYIIVNVISCGQDFDLYDVIFIVVSLLFVLYSFSMGKEKLILKYRNDMLYVSIQLFLACSYMVVLLLLNFDLLI